MSSNDSIDRQAVVRRDDNDPSTVHVAGEIDVATSPALKDELYRMLDQGQQRVVVDLAEMSFIDSSGLGVLVGTLKRAREQGGEVVLRSMQPSARKVVEITGLTEIFTIED
jgi:anti-sigma B factor antagonist